MHCALGPEGWLLLGFHRGEEVIHLDEWWGVPVCLDAYFFEPKQIAQLLDAAGFNVQEIIEREPYPEVEYPSRRAYVFAQKTS
jgi:hypothetical protein